MKLGTLDDLVEAMGGNVSKNYACALKGAAGMRGTRIFDVDRALQFKARNPAWKITDVYAKAKRHPTAKVQPLTSSGTKR